MKHIFWLLGAGVVLVAFFVLWVFPKDANEPVVAPPPVENLDVPNTAPDGTQEDHQSEAISGAAPHSEMLSAYDLPPGHPPLTRHSKNIPEEEIARQMAAREAEKQAYVQLVAEEHWLDSLHYLSKGTLPRFFTKVGSIQDSLSTDSAEVLADLGRDPRIAKLMALANGDDPELRSALHHHAEIALETWTQRFEETPEGGYTGVHNGALALPLLYHLSGDDPYSVGETLTQAVEARQAVLGDWAAHYEGPNLATTDYVYDSFSNISSDFVRLNLRSLSENEAFLASIAPESRAILEDFRRFQEAVARHQQGTMQAISTFFQYASTSEFPDPYVVADIDLVDLISSAGNTRLPTLELQFAPSDARLSPMEIPIHYFQLLRQE